MRLGSVASTFNRLPLIRSTPGNRPARLEMPCAMLDWVDVSALSPGEGRIHRRFASAIQLFVKRSDFDRARDVH